MNLIVVASVQVFGKKCNGMLLISGQYVGFKTKE